MSILFNAGSLGVIGEGLGWFLVGTFVVFRFAHALALETGPWAVLAKIREKVIVRFGYETWQSEFVRCPLCMGFWLSLAVTLAIYAGGVSLIGILFLWWGMAGFMTILYLLIYGR